MRAASRAAADPGLLAQAWSMAEQAQATAGTQPEHRALGLLWFALGAARLRRWEILGARYALNHAARQLTAGGLTGLRPARGWQALAEAWHGDLTAARWGQRRPLGGAASAGPPAPGPAVPGYGGHAAPSTRDARDGLGLGRATGPRPPRRSSRPGPGDVSLRRDELPGQGWTRTAGGMAASSRATAVQHVAGLIRARTVLADGDATGARALCRLRDTSASGDPALDGC